MLARERKEKKIRRNKPSPASGSLAEGAWARVPDVFVGHNILLLGLFFEASFLQQWGSDENPVQYQKKNGKELEQKFNYICNLRTYRTWSVDGHQGATAPKQMGTSRSSYSQEQTQHPTGSIAPRRMGQSCSVRLLIQEKWRSSLRRHNVSVSCTA